MSKKLGILFVISLLIVLGCFFFMNRNYNMEFYQIQLGNSQLSYYVEEKNTKSYLFDFLVFQKKNMKNYTLEGNNQASLKNLSLVVSSSHCMNSEKRLNCSSFYDNGKTPTLKNSDMKITNLKILFKDKLLYEGDMPSNLGTYIKQKGRYYFVISYQRQEKNSLTVGKILTNVMVGE